jgi:hypothetical protein
VGASDRKPDRPVISGVVEDANLIKFEKTWMTCQSAAETVTEEFEKPLARAILNHGGYFREAEIPEQLPKAVVRACSSAG